MRCAVLLCWVLSAPLLHAAEPKPETLRAWTRYVAVTEARIARELSAADRFLLSDFLDPADRRKAEAVRARGGVFTKKLETPGIEVPDGMIHHWVGSIFVPGAWLEDLVRFLQAYDEHESTFEEVEESHLRARSGERFDVFLRLRRTKVITVHYATEHRVIYRRHGPGRASSASRATRIAEIENAGTPQEREKPVGEDRGFLWRLNSYWRFQQVEDGVFVECESVSLSRGVPAALRWVVGRYLDSVPRESLESTLVPIRESGSRTTFVQPSSLRSKSR